jgi:hypothetical protein
MSHHNSPKIILEITTKAVIAAKVLITAGIQLGLVCAIKTNKGARNTPPAIPSNKPSGPYTNAGKIARNDKATKLIDWKFFNMKHLLLFTLPHHYR